MTGDERLPLRQALRFAWHCARHRAHADAVWYDIRANAVRCKNCGRQWA
jgi:hypothetical protein